MDAKLSRSGLKKGCCLHLSPPSGSKPVNEIDPCICSYKSGPILHLLLTLSLSRSFCEQGTEEDKSFSCFLCLERNGTSCGRLIWKQGRVLQTLGFSLWGTSFCQAFSGLPWAQALSSPQELQQHHQLLLWLLS